VPDAPHAAIPTPITKRTQVLIRVAHMTDRRGPSSLAMILRLIFMIKKAQENCAQNRQRCHHPRRDRPNHAVTRPPRNVLTTLCHDNPPLDMNFASQTPNLSLTRIMRTKSGKHRASAKSSNRRASQQCSLATERADTFSAHATLRRKKSTGRDAR
jgi:hypothetical protein